MKRVAIVHDWLTGMRGGERVLESLLGIFPDAEIFTLLHVPGSVSERIEQRTIHTSFLGSVPRVADHYRYYLPLFPRAIERFDFTGYDLIVSSSHSVAKGARAPNGVPHLCYCHTPMRYIWDQYDAYFAPGRARVRVRAGMSLVAGRLRKWDVASATRVTSFVANSENVRERIRRCYDRESAVVYPPVAVERFVATGAREDFYVIVSALVPYKRIDVAVRAFNKLGRRLLVVGDGPELARLQNGAEANVVFLGRVSDEEVADLLGRARALIVPGEEDFGIAPVEAQAAGAPVIAYRRGGVLETVIDAEAGAAADGTGVFFDQPTWESLADAVVRFEKLDLSPAVARVNAERFDGAAFDRGMRRMLAEHRTAAA